MCNFFSISATAAPTIAVLFVLMAGPAFAQDWRTSGEDPCACTDSMPFIVGARPPVDSPADIAARLAESADASCRTSRAAVESLRKANHDSRATQALVAQLGSTACALRASAAWSLATHHSPLIAPALLRLLADPDRRVRQAAAYGLGVHGDRAAVPALIALLQEPTKHVRQAAVDALGRIGDPAARPAIERLLADPEPHVRDAAAEAIRRLSR